MPLRALVLVALLLSPAAVLYVTVGPSLARYLALGTFFAFVIGVSSRPIAPFALLIPVLYVAAAITSSFTDGVAALIVAVAAAAGAASSRGYHRGLFGMLAAVLIASFEPAEGALALARGGVMLAGVVYGLLLISTVARDMAAPSVAVQPQTALSYAVLLVVLVLAAWVLARMTGSAQAWWLPLAVAAVGEPSLHGSAARAVARLTAALTCTLLLLVATQWIDAAAVRAAWAGCLLLALLSLGRRQAWLQGFLLAPLVVLLAGRDATAGEAVYLHAMLLASALVFAFTALGKWMLWTLRPDEGRVPA